MKRCSRCGEEKDVIDFPKDKRSKDGLASRCKACNYQAVRECVAKDPKRQERQRESTRKWRSENMERHRERKREWERLNPEKVKAQRKRSYARHKERCNAQSKAWREANADKVRGYYLRYFTEKYDERIAKKREWYRANKDACLARMKAWRERQNAVDVEAQRIGLYHPDAVI